MNRSVGFIEIVTNNNVGMIVEYLAIGRYIYNYNKCICDWNECY